MRSPDFSPAPRPSARACASAFTRKELVIAIVLLAVVIFLIQAAFRFFSMNGARANALDNAKGIAMVLRLYASDHDGNFPSFILHDGRPTDTPVSDSNTAFAQLFPNYVNTEQIFWLRGSAFCSPAPPDEVKDDPPLDTPVKTLKSGENEWAYVLALKDTSNAALPLLASGFANPVSHTYARDPSQKGGVWKGLKALVVRVDSSGAVMDVDQVTMTVTGPNGGYRQGDTFTTANAAHGWLAPANIVVNPK